MVLSLSLSLFMFQSKQNEMNFRREHTHTQTNDRIKVFRSNDKKKNVGISRHKQWITDEHSNGSICGQLIWIHTVSHLPRLMHIFASVKCNEHRDRNSRGSGQTDESLNEEPETERMRQLPILIFFSVVLLLLHNSNKIIWIAFCHFWIGIIALCTETRWTKQKWP